MRVAGPGLQGRMYHREGVSAAKTGRGAGRGGAALRNVTRPMGAGRLGHLGTSEIDGEERKVSGFTFTLGDSRMMMAEAALTSSFRRCSVNSAECGFTPRLCRPYRARVLRFDDQAHEPDHGCRTGAVVVRMREAARRRSVVLVEDAAETPQSADAY